MNKLIVKSSDCAICKKKGVDTIQADCNVSYRGERINQAEPVCLDCMAKLIPVKKVETHAVKKVDVKETVKPKPEPKPAAKYPKEETVAANYSKPKKAY